MPATGRRAYTCPDCALKFTLVATQSGATLEYDLDRWTRVCKHASRGSPIMCPALKERLKPYLSDDD